MNIKTLHVAFIISTFVFINIPAQAEDKQDLLLGESETEDLNHIFLRDTVLLKPWEKELNIAFIYNSSQFSFIKDRYLTVPLSIRIGLPHKLETFAVFPVGFGHREILDSNGNKRYNTFGIGDLKFGIKKQLLTENNGLGIIGSFGISIPSGKASNNLQEIPSGTGHWSVSAGVSAIKTNTDPVILFGGIGLQHTFDNSSLLFDSLFYNFGFSFSINDRITFSQQFESTLTYNSSSPDFSIQEPMNLSTGISYRVNKQQYIQPSVSFGLNDDSTDTSIEISYSFKF